MGFVVAHITDTHLSASKPFFSDNFRIVADDLKASRPDLVVNTGDVSVNGADLTEDLVTARAMHDRIGVPWLAVPGNHDVGDNQETARKQPINAERRARWLEIFGADYWTRDVPGWRLLGIDSLLLGSDLPEATAQQQFVAEAARTLGDRRLALFLHKPLFHDSPDDADVNGHVVTPGPRRLLMEALRGVVPGVVCCGHLHEYRERTAGALHQIWAPATAFTLSDWFLPTHGGVHTVGYVRIEFEADGRFASRLVQPQGLKPLDLADFPAAYGDLRQIKAAMDAHHARHATAAAS